MTFARASAERLNRLAGKVRNSERPLYDERMKDYNTKEGFEDLAFELRKILRWISNKSASIANSHTIINTTMSI